MPTLRSCPAGERHRGGRGVPGSDHCLPDNPHTGSPDTAGRPPAADVSHAVGVLRSGESHVSCHMSSGRLSPFECSLQARNIITSAAGEPYSPERLARCQQTAPHTWNDKKPQEIQCVLFLNKKQSPMAGSENPKPLLYPCRWGIKATL